MEFSFVGVFNAQLCKKMIFSKKSLIVTGIIFGSSVVYYLYKRNIEESDEVFIRNGRIKLYKHIELVF